MLLRKKFFFEIILFKNIFLFRIVPFKYARKTQTLRILRGKLKQNVIFCVQIFFQNRAFQNFIFLQNRAFLKKFFFKIVLFKKLFLFKNWRVVKILNQNLTRHKIFNSKSDAS